MQKVTLIASFLLVSTLALMAWKLPASAPKNHGKGRVNWVTLKEAEGLWQTQKKPMLIDLYTDWCGWCKVMDKQTYSHEKVADYINTHFIPVKLDAETREAIQWQGKGFAYNPSYRVNMYAVYLTGGQLSFPTTVFIPADGSQPQPVPGFLEPKDIESILKYFGEGYYGRVAFQDFQKKFTGSWK